MPATRIATGEWARGQESKVLEAVQAALITALKIPDGDRDVILDIVSESSRIVPDGKSERYTRVEITLFSGRSMNAKRALYKQIVENLKSIGVPIQDVKTILIEVPPENWGLRGGLPASEIDIGFKVDV